MPTCIRIRYGQNRRILDTGNVAVDSHYWNKDFNLPHIARIQLALANHYA